MTPAILSPYYVALRFIGLAEAAGGQHNAAIVAMLQSVDRSVMTDETAWCSAFVNYIAWLFGLQRSKSLAARSWLHVGAPIELDEARAGCDVVILSRGLNSPPATVIAAPGHVGFYSSHDRAKGTVRLLGGNQGNRVSLEDFPIARVLGVRRLV